MIINLHGPYNYIKHAASYSAEMHTMQISLKCSMKSLHRICEADGILKFECFMQRERYKYEALE